MLNITKEAVQALEVKMNQGSRMLSSRKIALIRDIMENAGEYYQRELSNWSTYGKSDSYMDDMGYDIISALEAVEVSHWITDREEECNRWE